MSRSGQGDAQDSGPQGELGALRSRIGAAQLSRRLLGEGQTGLQPAPRCRAGPRRRAAIAPWLIRTTLRLVGLHARGQRNALDIQYREHEVRVARLPSAFDGYRLLHLSDLHLGKDPALVQRLIERLQGLRHHLCVLTGDYCWGTGEPWQPAVDALARLRPHLGDAVYAVLATTTRSAWCRPSRHWACACC